MVGIDNNELKLTALVMVMVMMVLVLIFFPMSYCIVQVTSVFL